ncbi:MAG: BamA/TamA family outer membrane protein [Bacteroidetes bacterium]|nr:BamA/TamA family outer membrane protein [Bacteroidota bacterium]
MTKTLQFFFLFSFLLSTTLFSQNTPADSIGKEKKGGWVALPVISYSPETKLGLGALGMRLFKFNWSDTTTRTSNVQTYLIFTTAGQLLFSPTYFIFTNNEKYFINGNIAIFKFPEFYYGVGNDLPESNEEEVNYNLIRWENQLLRKLSKVHFGGLQIRYFNQYNVIREEGGLLDSTQVAGFNGSVVAGLGPVLLYDSRDNVVNASKGFFLELSATFHGHYFGGEYNFQRYRIDVRKFLPLNPDRSHVLAFQFLGNFVVGEAPFKQLSELGGDEIMRGYYRGRYRDQHLLAVQSEFRFTLWRFIGMVVFAGVGDVANNVGDFNFADIKPSFGVGLRVMVNKKEKVNIRADLGFGKDSSGFYLDITEAF